MPFDFAVVGGGPAGLAAAAMLAGGGARTLLIDAPSLTAPKAGEFLHPNVKAYINGLNILPEGWALAHLPVHGFVNGWANRQAQETDYIFDANGYALSLDRRLFEQQLRGVATARAVDLRMGSRLKDVEQTADMQWRIKVKAESEIDHFNACYLILATGRDAPPPIREVQRKKFDRLTFLAARFPDAVGNSRPILECFDSGWVYVTPVPGNAQIVYIFFDARLGIPCLRTITAFRDKLASCPRVSAVLNEMSEVDPKKIEWFSGAAHSGRADRTLGQQWCFLGDLAESRDPLAASGILNALRDASRVVTLLLSGGLTESVAREMDAERAQSFADYINARQHYYAQERRWANFPFWAGRGGAGGNTR